MVGFNEQVKIVVSVVGMGQRGLEGQTLRCVGVCFYLWGIGIEGSRGVLIGSKDRLQYRNARKE